MAPIIFDALPPEMLMKICDSVEAEDYLCLKLSCRLFGPYLTKTLATVIEERPGSYERTLIDANGYKYWTPSTPTSKERFRYITARTEALVLRDKPSKTGRKKTVLSSLLCTRCDKIKVRTSFTDTQVGRTIVNAVDSRERQCLQYYEMRQCIPCNELSYNAQPSKRASVKIDGQDHFVCALCKRPHLVEFGVHLRDGQQKACTTCADAGGLEYTVTKKGAPCRYVVYDDWMDIKHVSEKYQQGDIPKIAAAKFSKTTKGSRLWTLRAALNVAAAVTAGTPTAVSEADGDDSDLEEDLHDEVG